MEYLVQEKTAAVLQSTEKAKVRILQMHHQVKLKRPHIFDGCYHVVPFRATRSGYSLGSRCRLRCRKGYTPQAGGGGVRKLCMGNATWTGGLGTCVPAPVTCPALRVPDNGNVFPDSCARNGSEVNTRCTISCREGFTLEGSEAAVCDRSRQWRYLSSSPPSCQAVRYPPPFIICPPDTVKALPPDSSSVYIMFSQPKTNVDWLR